MKKELYHARWRIHHATADLNYFLECFGDHLADEESYPSGIDGFSAIYLYLGHKHGWTIRQCRDMSMDDLRIALSIEMKGWRLPADAIHAGRPREQSDC